MDAEALSDPAVVEHYSELAQEDPVMRPMLILVERLAHKEYADSVPAATSHNALVVTWPQGVSWSVRARGEMASVHFDQQMRCFRVEYRTRDSRVIRHTCGLEGAETLFDCYVLRLFLTDRS